MPIGNMTSSNPAIRLISFAICVCAMVTMPFQCLSHGYGNRTVHVPSSLQSRPDGALLKAAYDSPLSERQFLPAMLENSSSGILHLLLVRGPTAVRWLVISISIRKPVERHAEWPFPHVEKEVLKLFPSLTNLDSPSAVVFEIGGARIACPMNHCPPSLVSLCGFSSISPRCAVAVRCTSVFYVFIFKAPTGFCSSACQLELDDNFFFATITQAFPCWLTSQSACKFNHCQAGKFASGVVSSRELTFRSRTQCSGSSWHGENMLRVRCCRSLRKDDDTEYNRFQFFANEQA